MYIESISIKSFGQLINRTINFHDGVNIIEGENESGKSTIATFIKFIFYGLSGKAEKGSISERQRFLNWDTKTASGALTLTHDNGKRYRIERELTLLNKGVRDSFKIIDLETNTPIKEDTTPDAFFIGVPEEVFMRTVFVSQIDGTKINGADIHEAVENILFSADEAINTQKALKRLDEARVMLLHKNRKGGKIYELVQDKQALKIRLEAAKKADDEIREKSKLYKEHTARLIKNKERLAVVAERIGHTEALEKLERLRNAKRLEEELDTIKKQLDSIHSQAENGFIPDRAYIEALHRIQSKIEFTEKEILHAQEEFASAENTNVEIEQTYPHFDISEGEESLHFISSKRAHSNAMKIYFYVFSALALLCAVFAGVFFVYSDNIIPGAIVSFAAVTLAIGATICYSISRKYAASVEEEFDKYGVASESELIKLLDLHSSGLSKQMALTSTIEMLGGKIERLRSDLLSYNAEASSLLAKWGRTYNSIDDLIETADIAEKIIDKLSKLRNAYESKLAAYTANSVKYSEEEEQRLLAVIDEAKHKVELDSEEYSAAKREYTFLSKAIDGLTTQINELTRQLAELRATSESPIRLSEQIKDIETKEAQYRAAHDAYELAYEKLLEASEKLRGSISPKLSKAASEFMRRATDNKYRTFGVDSSFGLQFRTPDGTSTHEVDYLSSGTQDLAYISLRLSLVELLFDNVKPPIIFDESFARLDDKRLCAVLAIIYGYAKKNIQVFILTSHTRDAKILGTLEGCGVIQI